MVNRACKTLSALPLLAILLLSSLTSTGQTNDSTWWSFQPIRRPALPALSGVAQNPIDHFILAKLEAERISPSAAADRRTLVRRLYFDLLGLPPAPEEIQAFVSEANPRAYELLVDRLLVSPHFGERWARHWLDVVRFAETHGFEMNNPRPNAWPYRDYVIRAFNEDLPYDRFILEQLAGDSMGADAATGFLVAGAWDQVKSPDEVLTKNQRADELHDIVNTTGTAFLGLTIGCARCHSHKFDPIPQTDYFAIKAVFQGIQHGDRAVRDAKAQERRLARESELARLREFEKELVAFEPVAQTGSRIDTNRLRAPVHPRLNIERFASVKARHLRFTISATTGLEPCIDELEVFSTENATNFALASFGTKSRASGSYPNSEIHRLEHLNDGKYGNSRSWISHENGRGWVQLDFPDEVAIARAVWARDREEKFKDRLSTDYRIEVSLDETNWTEVASSRDRRAFKAGEPFVDDYAIAGLPPDRAGRLKELLTATSECRRRIREFSAENKVYAGEFKEPEPTRRFIRGDPMMLAEVVPPGTLTKIGTEPCAAISTDTPEQQRRIAFARWIASTNNPLTARIIVNRIWQYHFGEGLVSTSSDFGKNGARPSHPELLDWLAAELMHPGVGAAPWSLKQIHRLILNSAAYRQSSRSREDALARDASTRLLWRFPPRRLEAEALRDAILSAAGKLDLRMGGPGWSPFEPNENYVRVYIPKSQFAESDFRRMVYATVIRQRPESVFGVFDCPDAGQIAPRRTRSTTPLQALNLLNSGFIQQASAAFAERLSSEAGDDPKAQARRAFFLAFGRAPDSGELAHSTQFIRDNSLPLFCRAIFNANEFSYLN
jgi:hypothetical protein